MFGPLIVDCDTGIDDTLALAYLLADGRSDLVAVTTVSGNTSAAQAARNTLDVLALAGRPEIPVAVGAHHPLNGVFGGGAPRAHGRNGIGEVVLPPSGTSPVALPAPELIVRTARAHPGALHLLGLGPATNLALALRLDPELPDLVAAVTLMAGAALVPGSATPVAESNVRRDPEAAAAVIDAGWPVTLVTMDATMAQRLEEPHRQHLVQGGPLSRVAGLMLEHYFGYYEPTLGRRCAPLHDPVAAAVATGSASPTLAHAVPVVVDTAAGPGRGQTLVDLPGRSQEFPRRPGGRARVVLAVSDCFADRLVERILPL
jgi:purine nucleosidase